MQIVEESNVDRGEHIVYCLPGLGDRWGQKSVDRKIIRAILQFKYKSYTNGADFKPLQGHKNLYSFRSNQQIRLFMTKYTCDIEGVENNIWVVVECSFHRHHTARFCREGVLQAYMERHSINDWLLVTHEEDAELWYISKVEFHARNMFNTEPDEAQKTICNEEHDVHVRNARNATLVIGGAGTGKSTVACESLTGFMVAHSTDIMDSPDTADDEQYQVMYATESLGLATQILSDFNAAVVNPPANVRVLIKTFAEVFAAEANFTLDDDFKKQWSDKLTALCQRRYPQTGAQQKARSAKKTQSLATGLIKKMQDPAKAWAEFSNILPLLAEISAGEESNAILDRELDAAEGARPKIDEIQSAYMRAGDNISMYPQDPGEQREIMFELWLRYFRKNPEFIPPAVRDEYRQNISQLFIDEAQDCNVLRLLSLLRITQCVKLYLAGEQCISGDSRFVVLLKYALRLVFGENVTTYNLGNRSYRCSLMAVELSNMMQRLRYTMTGGTVNNMETPEIVSVSGNCGAAAFASSEEELAVFIRYVLANSVPMAFIVADEASREELKQKFNIPEEMIYSAREIKGREVKNCMLYKPFGHNKFTEVNRYLGKMKESGGKIRQGEIHGRTGVDIDNELERVLNEYLVAVTRSMHSVLVYAPVANRKHLCEYVQSKVAPLIRWLENLETVFNDADKERDWAQIITESANQGDFERARKLMTTAHISSLELRDQLVQHIAERENITEEAKRQALVSPVMTPAVTEVVAERVIELKTRKSKTGKSKTAETKSTESKQAELEVPEKPEESSEDTDIARFKLLLDNRIHSLEDLIKSSDVENFRSYTWFDAIKHFDKKYHTSLGYHKISALLESSLTDPDELLRVLGCDLNVSRTMPVPHNLLAMLLWDTRYWQYLNFIHIAIDGTDLASRFACIFADVIRYQHDLRFQQGALQMITSSICAGDHLWKLYSRGIFEFILTAGLPALKAWCHEFAPKLPQLYYEIWMRRDATSDKNFLLKMVTPRTMYWLFVNVLWDIPADYITEYFSTFKVFYNSSSRYHINLLWALSVIVQQNKNIDMEKLNARMEFCAHENIATKLRLYKMNPDNPMLRDFSRKLIGKVLELMGQTNWANLFVPVNPTPDNIDAGVNIVPWYNLPRTLREKIILNEMERDADNNARNLDLFTVNSGLTTTILEFLIRHDIESVAFIAANSLILDRCSFSTLDLVARNALINAILAHNNFSSPIFRVLPQIALSNFNFARLICGMNITETIYVNVKMARNQRSTLPAEGINWSEVLKCLNMIDIIDVLLQNCDNRLFKNREQLEQLKIVICSRIYAKASLLLSAGTLDADYFDCVTRLIYALDQIILCAHAGMMIDDEAFKVLVVSIYGMAYEVMEPLNGALSVAFAMGPGFLQLARQNFERDLAALPEDAELDIRRMYDASGLNRAGIVSVETSITQMTP